MTGCVLVPHFPDFAISSLCFFMVCHFQVLQIQRPQQYYQRVNTCVDKN